MKKKLVFLASPILTLGLIAGHVNAEPKVDWESHEIVTKIEEVDFLGQKLFYEKPTIIDLEVGLGDISSDKLPEIDKLAKEYFELITKNETVRKDMWNTFGVIIPEEYTRKEIKHPKNDTLRLVEYVCEGTPECYNAWIIYEGHSLVIKLRLIANHEHSLMLKMLEKADVKRIPKSLESIQITDISYPSWQKIK